MMMLNGKDSFWLQLEVCREFQRSRCNRADGECKFAHPPTNVEVQSNGRVTACYDSIKGRCQRESCKYMHPPAHLKDQLLINGRNHLALKNALLAHQQQEHQQHFHHPSPQNQHQPQGAAAAAAAAVAVAAQHQHQHQQAALFQSAVAAAAQQHQQHLAGQASHQHTNQQQQQQQHQIHLANQRSHIQNTSNQTSALASLRHQQPHQHQQQLSNPTSGPQAYDLSMRAKNNREIFNRGSLARDMMMLNGKDSFWLQLEVCREFQRSRCNRADGECKFAHPPTNVEVQSNGRVTACYDSIKGRCQRESCKYMHPPAHLKDQLLINGRNHLALKNALLAHQQQEHQQHFHHPSPQNQHQPQGAAAAAAAAVAVAAQHQHQHQQAALFQSAVAAAAQQHQQHLAGQASHQHTNQQQQQQQHQIHLANQRSHIQNTSNQTSALASLRHQQPHQHQQQLSNPTSGPQAYDLSMQGHPAAAALAALAASSINPFMTPNAAAFSHTYANQYAAAVAAAAAAAQPTARLASYARQENSDERQRATGSVSPHADRPAPSGPSTVPSSTSNNLTQQQKAGYPSKHIIEAGPTHYPDARAIQAAAAAAAMAAAAAASSSSTPPGGDQLSPYYMSPAMAAAAAALLGTPQHCGPPPATSTVAGTFNPTGHRLPYATGSDAYHSILSALYAAAPQQPPYAGSPSYLRPSFTVNGSKNAPNHRKWTASPRSNGVKSISPSSLETGADDESKEPEEILHKSGDKNNNINSQDQTVLRAVRAESSPGDDHETSKVKIYEQPAPTSDDATNHCKRLHLDTSTGCDSGREWSTSPISGAGNVASNDTTDKTGLLPNTGETTSDSESPAIAPEETSGQAEPGDAKSNAAALGLTVERRRPISGSSEVPAKLARVVANSSGGLLNGQHQQQSAYTSASSNGHCPKAASEAGKWPKNGYTRQASPISCHVPFRLEVCREFLRSSCKRLESECKFAHPPKHILDSPQLSFVPPSSLTKNSNNNNASSVPSSGAPAATTAGHYYVTVCMDFMGGRCARSSLKCRYLHPVAHLQCKLIEARRVANWTVTMTEPATPRAPPPPAPPESNQLEPATLTTGAR